MDARVLVVLLACALCVFAGDAASDAEFVNAVRRGDHSAVRVALEADATLANLVSVDMVPVLHSAASKGDVEMIRLLIEKGADVNTKNAVGYTALHRAVMMDSVAAAELLLDSGADINAHNIDGWTALHRAARYGAEKTLKLLCERGADVNTKNKFGWTALHIIARYHGTDEATLLPLAKLLIEKYNANVMEVSRDGWTPLHVCGSVQAMKDFLRWGGKDILEVRDRLGVTPFLGTVRNGDMAGMKFLKMRGANVNARTNEGNTALHLARIFEHEDIAEELILMGLDVTAKNKAGQTPDEAAAASAEKRESEDAINQRLQEESKAELRKQQERDELFRNTASRIQEVEQPAGEETTKAEL